jgi:ribosomal protein S27E
MKMGNMMVKRIVMVIAVLTVVAIAGISGHITAEAQVQYMEISCPHCHELTTVDVMQDDVECTHCLENIHIDG